MIDPSMDRLVDYLMKVRGETENPMMPPQAPQPEINPAVAQILQMAQGANPMMAGGVESQPTINPYVNRGNQIQQLLQGQQPVAAPAPPAPVEQEQSAPLMSPEQLRQYQLDTEKLKKANEKPKSSPKKNIEVEEVTVLTPDGEELQYKDKKTGKIYKTNPND